jgi:hypothetical protein
MKIWNHSTETDFDGNTLEILGRIQFWCTAINCDPYFIWSQTEIRFLKNGSDKNKSIHDIKYASQWHLQSLFETCIDTKSK